MNAALGFDSYLVMRYGVTEGTSGATLGCYFCSDVVAAADVWLFFFVSSVLFLPFPIKKRMCI